MFPYVHMPDNLNADPTEKKEKDAKPPEDKKQSTGERIRAAWVYMVGDSAPRWVLNVLVVIFVAALIVKTLEHNPGERLTWLSEPSYDAAKTDDTATEQGGLPDDIAKALGPILALALAIERLVETIFDLFEKEARKFANKLTTGAASLDSLEKTRDLYSRQLQKAMDDFEVVVKTGVSARQKEALSALELAQKKLVDVGDLMQNLSKDPKYILWKRAISIWLSLVTGMIVAVMIERGVFFYLELSVPRFFDMLLTGLVLGAGSGPLHSLIGTLQGVKDALGSFAASTGTSAVQKELQALRSQIENLPNNK